MTYQEKKKMIMENARLRKEKEIQEMNDSLSKVIKNVNVINTIIQLVVKFDDSIISYGLTTYPNCNKLSIDYRRNEYPFDYYYSKEYYDIKKAPLKHRENLQKLIDKLEE